MENGTAYNENNHLKLVTLLTNRTGVPRLRAAKHCIRHFDLDSSRLSAPNKKPVVEYSYGAAMHILDIYLKQSETVGAKR